MSAPRSDTKRVTLRKLGSVPNVQRQDIPALYSLRVTRNAWNDLGLTPQSIDLDALLEQHQVLAKFVDEFENSPAKINNGVLLDIVKHARVYRIRVEAWRAAVWYDSDNGIVWLCRVISLNDFPEEDKAYNEFGQLHDNDKLLPDTEERKAAASGHYLAKLIDAFITAMEKAEQKIGEQQIAIIENNIGDAVSVGRVCVTKERIDSTGALVTRFLLIIQPLPLSVSLCGDWREALLGLVLPADEEIKPGYDDLPPWMSRRQNEFVVMQEVIELDIT